MKKISGLAACLVLAACGAPPPPVTFKPLDYSYLHPITLKVAAVNVVDNYQPSPAEVTLNANNPAPPEQVLQTMLSQRLQPSGAPGTANVTIQLASVNELNGNLNGQMTVDVSLTSPDGRSTGFTEASVSASQTAPDSGADPNDVQTALYGMTKKLMDAMNVQLEYQILHNIPSWVVYGGPAGAAPAAAVMPGGIQAAPLSAPPGGAAPGVAPGTAPGAVPAAGSAPLAVPPSANPAVPNYLPGAGPAALGAPP